MPTSNLRHRSFELEILDDPTVPEHVREQCYGELARTHCWLGNTRAIVGRIRRDPLPVRKVLDIGCGHGALMQEVQNKLKLEVVGVDLLPPQRHSDLRILRCDAIREGLPVADIAVSVTMIHHLSEGDLKQLIRNVRRSCRRFLILDLVRDPAPLALFRAFVAPFVNPINVEDGIRSVRRAFTSQELNRIVKDALAGGGSSFRHQVAPFSVRQIVDIRY